MKLLWWMSLGSILTAIVITFVTGRQTRMEIWLGMAGPLIATIAILDCNGTAIRQKQSRDDPAIDEGLCGQGSVFCGLHYCDFAQPLRKTDTIRDLLCRVLSCFAYCGSDWIEPNADRRKSGSLGCVSRLIKK